MSEQYDVVIAGAGIVGASIAYHLDRLGMSVAIVDATGPAAGASGAADGAVSVCTKKSGAPMRLAEHSLSYCAKLSKIGGPLSGIFFERPSYYLATCERENDALDELKAKIATSNGQISILSDTGKNTRLSGLGKSVSRVVEVAGEGHMIGYLAVAGYLRSSSAQQFWPRKIQSIQETDTGVLVNTDDGSLSGRNFVLATGLSAGALIPSLPITPKAGQLVVTDRSIHATRLPGSLVSASYLLSKSNQENSSDTPPVVIDPLATGQFLIGSSREDHGDSERTDFRTIRNLLTQAVRCFEPIAALKIIRIFLGIRAAVSDGMPIVGAFGGSKRIFVASGFEGDGICLSAIIGREVSRLISGQQTLTELQTLSPQRFDQQRMVSQ